jgi:pimeloyl-ACP methyl ester carboxylesterase
MGDIHAFAQRFRVYAIDVIGEPGLSAPSRPRLDSDAHALWLDEVLGALGEDRVSIAGISLGGWLALDYATRRPERVERMAVQCPGGVGRQKLGIVIATLGLRMCGSWGKQKLRERVLGRPGANPAPGVKAFLNFMTLIHENFRPRMVKLPIFSGEALGRLTMPVLAIVGGRDVLLDSAETRRRLERCAAKAEVVYLAEQGHLIQGQSVRVLEFLSGDRPAQLHGM